MILAQNAGRSFQRLRPRRHAMLDLATPRGKIIDAALRLAASDGWSGLSLNHIAAEAGVSLADFRHQFRSKAEILVAFTRAVDDAVLAKSGPAEPGAGARDRLFDVLMTRFEVMAPYRDGLRRIRHDLRFRPAESAAQLGALACSQYWMLAAAGIETDSAKSALGVPGLLGVYARVLDVWLDDSDPGLAKTMAALDVRLRRGEHFMQRLDDIRHAAERFACAFLPKRTACCKPAAKEPAPAEAPAQSGGAEPGSAPAT
jgi:ubiquinone biosynthesis protein COQ9